MKALCWHGKQDVRVETVNDPEILNPRDAIIKVTSTAICGSDLHIYHGRVSIEPGFTLGHEYVGTVVAVVEEGRNPQVWRLGDDPPREPRLSANSLASARRFRRA
jgi:threonine dehydrogenase-like Zn-dependent dehydrogenase